MGKGDVLCAARNCMNNISQEHNNGIENRIIIDIGKIHRLRRSFCARVMERAE